ncbi:hypothetical protein LUZ60_005836 [Juncus effusus]|nr:hypothetical protein LUZ60_005836 [Juncus effusus]
MTMSSPHALVLPWPAQGHIIPLMHLSHFLSNHGFKITFVNTEHNHNRIVRARNMSDLDQIRMISIPDGFGPDENPLGPMFFTSFQTQMSSLLMDLIKEINEGGEEKIICIIADVGMVWALEIAQAMGIRFVAFSPASAACIAVMLSIPKLMADGVIDENGLLRNGDRFQLTPNSPAMDATHLAWSNFGDRELEKFMFQFAKSSHVVSKADFILCNSFQELELPFFNIFPNIIPIGPLPIEQVSDSLGHLWSNDETYLNWLDQQSISSVVYVSFGSLITLDQTQFQELSLGLEMSQMPFLWVIRSDSTSGYNYLKKFQEDTKGKGKIVGWCNQEKVLAHSSIACFISHCGWNSTLDGIKNGVPFLCWPFIVDQFANQNYICDVFEVGLKLVKSEDGIVKKEHICSRLSELMMNEKTKMRANEMKTMAKKSISKGGSSFTNLSRFIEAMKM